MLQQHHHQAIIDNREWLFFSIEQWATSNSWLCRSADKSDLKVLTIQMADGRNMILTASKSQDYAELFTFAPVSTGITRNQFWYVKSILLICQNNSSAFTEAFFDHENQYFGRPLHLPLSDRPLLEQHVIPQLERAYWYVGLLAKYLAEICAQDYFSCACGKKLSKRFRDDIQSKWHAPPGAAVSG